VVSNVSRGEAFPSLPPLKSLPLVVDPDSWLRAIDKAHFIRKVKKNGKLKLAKYDYYLGQEWAGK
jgi:hypothetical protein